MSPNPPNLPKLSNSCWQRLKLGFLTVFFLSLTLSLQIQASPTTNSNSQSSESNQRDSIRFKAPKTNWAVKLSSPGFEIQNESPKKIPTTFNAINENLKLEFELLIDIPKNPRGGLGALEYYEKKLKKENPLVQNFKKYKAGPYYVIEYSQNTENPTKTCVALWSHENYWLKATFKHKGSKEGGDPINSEDKSDYNFIPLLSLLSIVRTTPLSLEENIKVGDFFFSKTDYPSAAGYYKDAYDMGRKLQSQDIETYDTPNVPETPQFPITQSLWNQTLLRLSLCYIYSGQTEIGVKLLKWSSSQSPKYPTFYYNQAYYYAQQGNKTLAANYLAQALKYQFQLPEGETIPDFRKGKAFQNLLSNTNKDRKAMANANANANANAKANNGKVNEVLQDSKETDFLFLVYSKLFKE